MNSVELDAFTQLNMDILSENMPDILLVDERMLLQSFISKEPSAFAILYRKEEFNYNFYIDDSAV